MGCTFYCFSFSFCATQAMCCNDLVSSKRCVLLCLTQGKGGRAKLIHKELDVDYSQRLPIPQLSSIFSRKENKGEIVFENLLNKNKSLLPKQP